METKEIYDLRNLRKGKIIKLTDLSFITYEELAKDILNINNRLCSVEDIDLSNVEKDTIKIIKYPKHIKNIHISKPMQDNDLIQIEFENSRVEFSPNYLFITYYDNKVEYCFECGNILYKIIIR